jgi:hypothetical protein
MLFYSIFDLVVRIAGWWFVAGVMVYGHHRTNNAKERRKGDET